MHEKQFGLPTEPSPHPNLYVGIYLPKAQMSDLLLNLLYISTSGGDHRTGNLEPTELVYSSSRTYLQGSQDLLPLRFRQLDMCAGLLSPPMREGCTKTHLHAFSKVSAGQPMQSTNVTFNKTSVLISFSLEKYSFVLCVVEPRALPIPG